MSSETIKELVVHLGVEADAKPIELFEEALESLKHGLLGGAASIAVAGEGLFELVKHTAEAGDQAIKMSQRVGINVQALQELSYAAKLADVSAEEFGQSLVFLNRHIADAAKGSSDSVKTFAKLGISQNALKSGAITADRALEIVADRFAQMPNGAQKTALAVDLFGRAGSRMIPMLNKGSAGLREMRQEAEDLGAVMSEADALLGEEFNDNLRRLGSVFSGLVKTIGIQLLPTVNEIVVSFRKFLLENKKIIKENFLGFAKGLANYLAAAAKVMLTVGQALAGIVKGMGGAERATTLFFGAIGLLSAASILFGVGRLIQTVYALATAFTAADAAALAIPIIIGAAVVALLLIFEDLAAYFRGENSVFGILEEKFNALPEMAKVALTAILTPVRLVANAFGLILDVINAITGKLSVMELLERTGSRLLNIFGFGNSANNFQGATGIGDPMANVFGAPRIVAPNAGGAGGPQNNIKTDITVTVPPGTDPAAVPGAVERGVASGLDGVLRQTNRATAGGIAY